MEGGEGSLMLFNHSAQVTVKSHGGPVNLKNYSGTTRLSELNGQIQLWSQVGTIQLADISGSVTGELVGGTVDAKMAQIDRFQINSERGAVTLDAPKTSGARVQLRSQKGKLWGPPYLGKIKRGQWTERKGRLRGKEQGNIKIISKYGDIVLK